MDNEEKYHDLSINCLDRLLLRLPGGAVDVWTPSCCGYRTDWRRIETLQAKVDQSGKKKSEDMFCLYYNIFDHDMSAEIPRCFGFPES